MTTHHDPHPDDAADRRLWQRAMDGACVAPGCEQPPDDLTLAAWLDGRLDGSAASEVERWLASSPEGRAGVRMARSLMADAGERLPFVASHVLDAARALVDGGADRGEVVAGRIGIAWRAVAAVAASLMICVIGYRVGLGSSAAPVLASDDLLREMTFGVLEADGPPGDSEIDLLAVALAAEGA